jgi:hypothetical protein
MQVSVDRWIVSPEVVQDFDVDEYIRDQKGREPEVSRAARFYEKTRPEMKGREGNGASSLMARLFCAAVQLRAYPKTGVGSESQPTLPVFR